MALLLLMMMLTSTLDTALASRQLRQAPDCGAAGAPCGASLSSKCHSSGPGYCHTGLFCGWNAVGNNMKTVCMPVPTQCGQPGKSCCPGNAKAPITDGSTTPKPTCDIGYCFYTPTPDASGWSGPPFASPAGSMLGTCRTLDLTCGSAAGKSCCPSLYKTGINPALPASITGMPGLCSGQLFCNTTTTTDAAGRYWPQGVCVTNKPDCGAFGKSCCIQTSGVATSTVCGPTWGVGYCNYPGGKSTGDMRDMVCTQCPPVSVVAADPSKYFGCKSM